MEKKKVFFYKGYTHRHEGGRIATSWGRGLASLPVDVADRLIAEGAATDPNAPAPVEEEEAPTEAPENPTEPSNDMEDVGDGNS